MTQSEQVTVPAAVQRNGPMTVVPVSAVMDSLPGPGSRATIVAAPGRVVEEISEALRSEGMQVRRVDPDAVAAETGPGAIPDLLLIAASLGQQRLAVICSTYELDGGTAPATVVFPDDGDLEVLEVCARAGFEYVVPPFLPGLLRSRMASCQERGQLTSTAEKLAVSSSLREYERELSIAREIQWGFLPEVLPELDGWELAKCFRPAKQVAGDFYDVFDLAHGRRVGLVVADVCDKGVGAALFMALIRTLLRHTAQHADVQNAVDVELAADIVSTVDADLATAVADDLVAAATTVHNAAAGREPGDVPEAVRGAIPDSVPAVVAETVAGVAADAGEPPPELPALPEGAQPLVQAVVGTNRYLARNHLEQGYFATMFFAVLDPVTGVLLYINGGHNPPVLRRADGTWSLLMPTGPAVGMMADSDFSLEHLVLEPGDTLFMYSDGVVEARNEQDELFGNDRMIELVCDAAPRGAQELVRRVDEELHRFVGHAEQSDDITMLAVRHCP